MKAKRLVRGGWVAWLLLAAALGAAPDHASAQDAERSALPRTLREGKPARRFEGKAVRQPARQPAPRAAATPSIVLDRSTLLGRAAMEARSVALLERELGILRRLLVNSRHDDPRRADVLLRLAYAYQELMFQQKLRIHRLREEHGGECSCSLPQAPEASAVACGEPAAKPAIVAAR